MGTADRTDPHERILIRSKLNRPELPEGLVARPRLTMRLDEGADRRVTLLAAPPGYGKTTLALQWLAQRAGDAAWISLDRGESEPDLFVRYLAAAVRASRPGSLARTAALLDSSVATPWNYFCEILLSELALLQAPLLLALDDCQTIASMEVHELIGRMVEGLPDTLRILALGRTDPPWPVARWRGKGWLGELRARDLRFSADEVRAFFAAAGAPALDDADLDLLGERTEGWPVGLQLAQISLANAPDPHQRALRFSGDDRLVVDYLMSEVLALQPPEIRELLAVTAPLERFCAPLCGHLLAERCPGHDAGELLGRLERDHLFLVPLDGERRWFRYHHLFRQLLMQHLPEAGDPAQRARIAWLAAEWFAGKELVEEALGLFVDAGELDAAAGLLGQSLHRVMDEDISRRVLTRWLALFPPGAERDRLPLLVAHAYLRVVRWDIGGIAELLEQAETCRSGDTAPDVDRLAADLDALKAFLRYWQGDVQEALRHADRALTALGDDSGGLARSIAVVYRAGALSRTGRYAEAMRFLDEAVGRDVARGGRRMGELLHGQAMLQLYHGDLDAVVTTARRMLATEEAVSIPVYVQAYAPYLLGVVALERGQLDDAEAHFRQVGKLRHLTNTRLYVDGLIGLALVAEIRSDREALAARTADARTFAIEAGDPTSLPAVESLEARVARFTGSSASLPPPASARLDAMSPWLEVPSLTYAENLLHHPDPAVRRTALPFVDAQLVRAEEVHNRRQALRLSVLRADALAAAGQGEEALELLERTLCRAEPQGMIHPFRGGGPRRQALLESLATRMCRGGLLELVLRATATENAPARDPIAASAAPTSAAAGVSLTLRELETLELLARRLTNKEIAARLSVTSAAVKKRLESVYAKLDVHGRREAVAAAVARGLIAKPVL